MPTGACVCSDLMTCIPSFLKNWETGRKFEMEERHTGAHARTHNVSGYFVKKAKKMYQYMNINVPIYEHKGEAVKKSCSDMV